MTQPGPSRNRTGAGARDRVARVLANEALVVVGLLAVVFLTYLFRLGDVVVADMDEGTYLYAGKLIAAGSVPFRDFMFGHPPVIAYLTAAWIQLFGSDVMAARIAYAVLVLASTVPLYVLARSLARSRLAGLLAVGSYTTGMLLVANMGRTIRLEPVMNAALIGAFALLLLGAREPRRGVIGGALLGVGTMIKLVAVLPIGSLFLAQAIWMRGGLWRRWAAIAVGLGAIVVPSLVGLLFVPHFVDDVLIAQLERPGLPLVTRWAFVVQDFVRDPLIPLGLVAAVWLVFRSSDARVRAVSFTALASGVALVAVFRTFFGYYLVQVLPWLSIALAVAGAELARRIDRPAVMRAIAGAAVLLVTVIPLAYDEVYYRTAHDHVASAKAIAAALEDGSGPVYSMYPSFALWSDRDACGSYYVADSLLGRITGRLGPENLIAWFSSCTTLVLWAGELDGYPTVATYVSRNFSLEVTNADYALWTKKPGP